MSDTPDFPARSTAPATAVPASDQSTTNQSNLADERNKQTPVGGARQIRKLSSSVVNKIAAGEVIERPSSVVKELMENSIDAGATRVDVLIEKGGVDLIRISDNGCGIPPEQLSLAVECHATSKIQSADDLFDVGSLGFRGEALASISEVSQFLIRSLASGESTGYEITVNGGHLGEMAPCGCPPGTVIEVRNLFFNTPVRRKFLKTTQTEIGHIGEAFTRIALAFPQIHFTLTHNRKTLHDLPPCGGLRERIDAFFGPEISHSLIPVSSEIEQIRLHGFAVDPTVSRSHTRMQYLFLNGRHIRDKSLQHALREAYRGLLLHGRFPIAFLNLEMPADQIDVNVHPAKLEVRFQEGGRIYSQLLGTLRNQFLSTDLKSHITSHDMTRDVASGVRLDPPSTPSPAGSFHEANRQPLSGSVPDFRKFTGSASDFQLQPSRDEAPSAMADQQSHFDFNVQRRDPMTPMGKSDTRESESEHHSATGSNPEQQVAHPDPMRPAPAHVDRFNRSGAIQIHNRYLVAESDDGVEIIDQHALHERILYEQIREKTLAGKMETQRLLVPEPVQLSPSEAAIALDAREEFEQIGIEIEPFGGDTILVTSYPAMLSNQNPGEMLRQLIEQWISGSKPERRDTIDELLHMISCKAAVKAGDRLTPEEITVLLDNRDLCRDSHHCPHGRPTALVFSREELDRRFKRI